MRNISNIRFRAKGTDELWWYGSLALFPGQQKAYIIPDTPTAKNQEVQYGMVSVSTDTIGQFTGMKDKNGRMIYEGDILQYYDDIEDELLSGPVSFDLDTCSFCIKHPRRDSVGLYSHWEYKVIGNIHEKGGTK